MHDRQNCANIILYDFQFKRLLSDRPVKLANSKAEYRLSHLAKLKGD